MTATGRGVASVLIARRMAPARGTRPGTGCPDVGAPLLLVACDVPRLMGSMLHG